MPRVTLTYFDFSASRGEECRLALHVAGVPFTDERLSREQWALRRESASRPGDGVRRRGAAQAAVERGA